MSKLMLSSGEPLWTVPANSIVGVTGTDGVDHLAISTGAKVTFEGGFKPSTAADEDFIYIQGDASAFTVLRVGTAVTLTDANGTEIKITAGNVAQTLIFGDGAVDLQITGTPAAVMLGDQTITDAAVAVTATLDTTVTSDSQFGGTTPPAGNVTGPTSVDEGSTATFTIKGTEGTTYDWAIGSAGTAQTADFEGDVKGSVTIPSGQTSVTFDVKIKADNLDELQDDFVVNVSSGGIPVGDVTVLINNKNFDFTAPVITASPITYAENQTTAGTTLATLTANETVTWSINDPNGFYQIDSATGAVSLTAAGIAAGAASNDFETAPNTFAPVVTATDGANNSSTATLAINVTNVDDDPPVLSTATGSSTKIVLAYNESLDSGSIPSKTDFYVTQTASGTTTVIDVANVSMTGSSVELALSTAVTAGATVKVSYTPGTKPIQDTLGFDAVALNNQAVTTDTTAPTLASSSPADNSTTMAVGDNITMTFSETVLAGTGSVKLYKSDGTIVETFNVATGAGDHSGTIAFSGTTVTINPGSDLTAAANYYINVDATAVKDSIGNTYAGISNTTTLNFGTTGSSGTTGKTVTLTQSADTVSPTQTNASFQTGDGDDTINGFLDSGAATFSPTLDNINAGAGTADTLIGYGQQGANSLANVTGVEKFTFRTAAAASFDMSTTSGYTYLTNEGSANAMDFLKISSTSPYLVVNGATGDTGFIHSATALQGASDAVNILVTGYIPGTGAVDATDSEGIVLNAGIETLNFSSSTSASSFGLWTDDNADGTNLGTEGEAATDTQGYASATTLAVTGNANLDLTGGLYVAHPFTGLKTIGANGFTGNMTLSLVGNTNAVTVTGGDGNDTVTFTGTSISKATGAADNINLGAGVMDTLGVSGALAVADYTTFVAAVNSVVSNTEAVLFFDTTISSATDNTDITATAFTNGIKYFIFNDTTASTGVNLVPTIDIDGLATTNAMIFNENISGHSATAAGEDAVKLSGYAAGQTANVTLGGATITGGSGVFAADNAGALAINGAAGFSTLALTSNSDAASNTNALIGGAGAGIGANSAAIDGFTNVTLTGSAEIVIRGLNEGIDDGVSVDATTFTAKSTIFMANDATTGDIFTGGSGMDNIYGLAGNDNISGNGGNDALYGGAGLDILSGGAGDDTLVSGDFPIAAAAATGDSMTGGDGTDTFYVAQAQQPTATDATVDANAYTIADFNASGEKIYLSSAGAASPTFGMELLGNTALTNLTWNAATGVDAVDGCVINIGTLATDAASTTIAGDLQAILNNGQVAGKIDISTGGEDFIVVFNSARNSTTYAAVINNTGAAAGWVDGTDAMTLIKLPGVTVADLAATDFGLYSSEVASGVTITGPATASYLYGTPYGDTITGGAAADTIVGGNGSDTIALGAAGTIDIVTYVNVTEMGGKGSNATYDTISGFTTAVDKIQFNSGGTFDTAIDDVTANNTIAWNASAINGTTAAINAGTDEAVSLTDAAGTTTLTDLTAVATLINAECTITTTGAAGADEFLFAIQSGGNTGIYLYTEAAAAGVNTVTAGELQLVGIASGALLVSGDFQIA